jgi:glucose-1-phosphate thymidylyltransferase
MKGIVLAGGTGTRLWPITKVVSKQLLPIYDKPMIYYPLSTLMLAGVRDILIISTPQDLPAFKALLGDGSQFGIFLSYAIQPNPDGLAQALIIGEDFLDGHACLMILGDNVFHGAGLGNQLRESLPATGAHIFTYEVADPSQYGVLSLSAEGLPVSVEEKPLVPGSNLAITGLYFFDKEASHLARQVTPSKRGELEITSLIRKYLQNRTLSFTHLSRGTAWLDTGTPNGLSDASSYIRVIEERTGLKIACLEEIALNNEWITSLEVFRKLETDKNSYYRQYLMQILKMK